MPRSAIKFTVDTSKLSGVDLLTMDQRIRPAQSIDTRGMTAQELINLEPPPPPPRRRRRRAKKQETARK